MSGYSLPDNACLSFYKHNNKNIFSSYSSQIVDALILMVPAEYKGD